MDRTVSKNLKEWKSRKAPQNAVICPNSMHCPKCKYDSSVPSCNYHAYQRAEKDSWSDCQLEQL